MRPYRMGREIPMKGRKSRETRHADQFGQRESRAAAVAAALELHSSNRVIDMSDRMWLVRVRTAGQVAHDDVDDAADNQGADESGHDVEPFELPSPCARAGERLAGD